MCCVLVTLLLQSKLDKAPRPGFLHGLRMVEFDMGCTAPQLRDVRAVAGTRRVLCRGHLYLLRVR